MYKTDVNFFRLKKIIEQFLQRLKCLDGKYDFNFVNDPDSSTRQRSYLQNKKKKQIKILRAFYKIT